jgi:Ca-activated chloride channel homolog
MRWGLLFLLAFIFTDLDKIGKINSVKAEAKKTFIAGDFETAAKKYRYLVDSLGVTEDEVQANLAASYFQLKDTTNAVNAYSQISQSTNKRISSVANQQLGVMADTKGNLEEALNYFKQAIKAAPENQEARYNYEVVKKKLEKQKKEQQQKQDQNQDKKEDQKDNQNKDKKEQDKKEQDKKDQEKKDQEKKDQQNKNQNKDQQQKEQEKKDQEKKDQEKKDKDQQKKEQEKKEQEQKEQDPKNKDKKETPPSVADKLKDMQITEEKAKMILEAMKNQEVQYLQQNRRKASKPKEKGKPDW